MIRLLYKFIWFILAIPLVIYDQLANILQKDENRPFVGSVLFIGVLSILLLLAWQLYH